MILYVGSIALAQKEYATSGLHDYATSNVYVHFGWKLANFFFFIINGRDQISSKVAVKTKLIFNGMKSKAEAEDEFGRKITFFYHKIKIWYR